MAVNDNNGLTAAWNGSSWKINQQFANEEIDFYAVSCMTASSCVAVSEASPPPAASYGWDGSRWRLQAKFSASGTTHVGFVRCATDLCRRRFLWPIGRAFCHARRALPITSRRSKANLRTGATPARSSYRSSASAA